MQLLKKASIPLTTPSCIQDRQRLIMQEAM